MADRLELVDLAQRPDLEGLFSSVVGSAWRHLPFMGYAKGDDDFTAATEARPDWQLGLLEPETGRVLAVGNSAPYVGVDDPDTLPADGWDWQAARAAAALAEDAPCSWLGAFSISVLPTARGRGIARRMIQAFRERAAAAGLRGVTAPVRPSLKATYPLAAMADYAAWTAADGRPFDPWLRSHVAVGGRIVRPCASSMTVEAHPARWEAWTGIQLPVSGPYVLPGCLAPVDVDRDAGIGRYVEPNIWVVHAD